MKLYKIETKQLVRTDLDTCWDFFSSPKNLKEITPDYMDFDIRNEVAPKMYPGQIIEYRVSPVAGIKMKWVTEISHVEDKKFFVDEQRFGPYKLWHHKHFFEPHPQGVMMTDLVHYVLPFGFLGTVAHGLFVKKQLEGIFDYRFKKVEDIFGK